MANLWLHYTGCVQDVVRGVRSRCLPDGLSGSSVGRAAEALGKASDAAAALPLLTTAGKLLSCAPTVGLAVLQSMRGPARRQSSSSIRTKYAYMGSGVPSASPLVSHLPWDAVRAKFPEFILVFSFYAHRPGACPCSAHQHRLQARFGVPPGHF